LKPAQRQLLWLAYVERFSHIEIAKMLSMKPQSIRPLLSRARHALAEVLRRGGFGETTR
jgi:RNA polymerase sigma-70 factor (ECF subfamily)